MLESLIKRQSFLCQQQSWSDSKPNSWYSFCLKVPLIVPVRARQGLYCMDSNFSWDEALNVWSKRESP